MSKNSILAFFLIIGVVFVFSHPMFYKYVWKIPYPGENKTAVQTPAVDTIKSKDTPAVSPAGRSAEFAPAAIVTPGILSNLSADSVSGGAQPVATDTIWVETDKLICGISEFGGRIISVKTKEYFYNRTRRDTTVDLDSIIELIPEATQFGGANLTLANTCFDSIHFDYQGDSERIIVPASGTSEARFSFTRPDGIAVVKSFSFSNGSYRIGFAVESAILDGKSVQVGWECGLRESEEPTGGQSDQYNKMKAHTYVGRDVEHIQLKKVGQKDESTGQFSWAGITSKYFLVALVPAIVRDADIAIQALDDPHLKYEKYSDLNYKIEMKRIAEGSREEYAIYAGPAKIQELRKDKRHLEKVLYGGWRWFLRADIWFPTICEYFLLLLIYLQGLVKDWGLAILLITVIIKVVTYPMSLSSMKSMSKMKDLQPKINAIRAKYKANPRKMNEEVMALYKTEGINPLNPGCLPMFLQMPLLIALFIVLQRAIELRGVPTILVPWIKDLSMPEAIFHLPFSLPMYGNNFAVIPIVMAVLTYFQNKMTIKDPNQKFMIWFMPLFMFVIFNNFPSGLVIYWTLSSALGLIQQKLVDRSIAANAPAPAPVEVVKKGGKRRKG